jgi:hypothetical protein
MVEMKHQSLDGSGVSTTVGPAVGVLLGLQVGNLVGLGMGRCGGVTASVLDVATDGKGVATNTGASVYDSDGNGVATVGCSMPNTGDSDGSSVEGDGVGVAVVLLTTSWSRITSNGMSRSSRSTRDPA